MKVFLSYSQEDRPLVEEIAEALAKAGHEPWMEDRGILPGQNWAEEVARALNSADAMVVILSERWPESRAVRHELEFALGDERFEGRLIPVILGDPGSVGLPAAVRYLKAVHVGRDPEAAVRRIVNSLSPARKAG